MEEMEKKSVEKSFPLYYIFSTLASFPSEKRIKALSAHQSKKGLVFRFTFLLLYFKTWRSSLGFIHES